MNGRIFYCEHTRIEKLAPQRIETKKEISSAISRICDNVRKSDKRIRHVGYYDRFGRILYDSIGYETALENTEEMHILNGTTASMLNLWRPASTLIGNVESFIMNRHKVIGLIIPAKHDNYFLAIFEAKTPITIVEKTRVAIEEAMKGSRRGTNNKNREEG